MHLNFDFMTDTSIDIQRPIYLKILQWTCPDECKYSCMWPTVDWFINAGIGVQQFYGKVQRKI